MHDLWEYVLMASLLPAAAFLIIYGLGSPWYKSALGTVMFLYAASVFGMLLLGTLALAFGDYPGREVIRGVFYIAFFCTMTAKVVVLIIERRSPLNSPAKGTHETRTTPHR